MLGEVEFQKILASKKKVCLSNITKKKLQKLFSYIK